jgi:hypothetical protein
LRQGSLDEIRGDAELLAQCQDAYRLATGRMRAKMAAKALAGRAAGDANVIEREVERRDRLSKEAFGVRAAARGADGLDFAALTDTELEIVECALSGNLGRLNELITVRAQSHIDAMRAELMAEIERHAVGGERAPAAEILPPARSRPRPPGALEVADPERPFPASRALVPQSARPPRQGGRLPKALGDPASPWFAGGRNDYPL